MGAAREQVSTLKGNIGIAPQLGTVAAHNGVGVDMQGFEALTFFASLGSAGVGTVKLQESDTFATGYTDVTDTDDFIGESASIALVQDGVVKIGYVGNKRFCRPVIDMTTGGQISCPGIEGYPHIAAV